MCKKTVRISFVALMFIVVGIWVLPKPMVCDAKSKLKFTHTKGKNKSDVKALKKIIRKNLRKDWQEVHSVKLYTNLDSSKYRWNAKGRLISFEANGVLKGDVSFSKLKKLKYLSVGPHDHGRIRSLDIKGCVSLKELNCFANKLTRLDISNNRNLQKLICSSNKIRKLDLSKNKSLKSLNCSFNVLKKLDVSACIYLEELCCSTDHLSKLDLSNNAALVKLVCEENGLTSIEFPNEAALTYIDCSLNDLSSIDLSSCKRLETFYCSNNELSSLDLSFNTALISLVFLRIN